MMRRPRRSPLFPYTTLFRSAAEEQWAAWVREKEYATTRRADLLKQYDEVKEQRDKIEQLGPEGTCPTCRRPLGAEYAEVLGDRKSTRLNSSHDQISYAVFCL